MGVSRFNVVLRVDQGSVLGSLLFLLHVHRGAFLRT